MDRVNVRQLSVWFEEYSKPMALYASQFLDRSEAEDVVQEVFVGLHRLTEFPREIRPWLYQAVRNAAFNRIRSRQRRLRREQSAHSQTPDWFEPRPGQQIDARKVCALLKNLEEGAREIVVLRIWADLTFDQIADIRKQSRTAVFRAYQSALSEIRQNLEKPCEKMNP